MATKAEIRALAERLLTKFVAAGAEVAEADVLQPAETLLDLYGEDIRARAFVTFDPLQGEMMLRPDFTVPVVLMHMQRGGGEARYAYLGEVFRRQEGASRRASEYLQVGLEQFGGDDAAVSDAALFQTITDVLEGRDLVPVTGDIGILRAAVAGLDTSEKRRAALMRHIWRPARFRQLLARFAGQTPVPPSRAALLSDPDPMARAAPLIGLRTREEIAARIEALRQDAHEPPIAADDVALIDRILELAAPAGEALAQLREIAGQMPSVAPAVEHFARRLDALASRGVDVDSLPFEASHGRTTLEYYDGFVFGFYAPGRPDLPPVASGGRYDAITRVLGNGQGVPAVGGVIRPGLLIEAAETSA